MVLHNNFSKLRLQRLKGNRFSVIFYLNGKRYRFSDGKPIDKNLFPNKLEVHLREAVANELLYSYADALRRGWIPSDVIVSPITVYDFVLAFEANSSLSEKYLRELEITKEKFANYLVSSCLENRSLKHMNKLHYSDYLDEVCISASVFNHERQRLAAILKKPYEMLGVLNPINSISKRKTTQIMHKPFEDVTALLEDIKSFNENLFLCCLFTYGCLLRPHQEIRNLKWGDFSEDMKHISLSGKRNKSGRNRIVPLNPYILQYLHKGEDTDNIFTGKEKPYNKDYFKTLWSRYKAQSNVLEDLQTLYSFRHSGAIEIYKRTGSLTILQQAMGHASLAVTLGYLRGLEIPSLKIEDMPRL